MPEDLVALLVKHERDLREQYAALTERALEMQAKEYDRRLGELNHAHARALEDKAQFLSKAIFEQTQREMASWREKVNGDLTRIRAEAMAAQRTWALVLSLLMLGLTVISIAVQVWLR